MKNIALIFFLFFLKISFGTNSLDSLLIQLDHELIRSEVYVKDKKSRIEALKSTPLTSENKYNLYANIFEEYKSFIYDSALTYLLKLNAVAATLGDIQKQAEVKINMGFIFISSGMYKEAYDTLMSIHGQHLNDELHLSYYAVVALYYFNKADQLDKYFRPIYEAKASGYVDSILMFSDSSSYTHQYYKGLRSIRQGKFEEGQNTLENLYKKNSLSHHEKAIVTSTLSDIFINLGKNDQAIALLAEATINDIQSATKETAAMLNLSSLLYNKGDIERAYTYTKQALADANYYGARHRKIQVSRVLSIVEEEKLNAVEKQRSMWLRYAIVVTILGVVILFFIIVVLRQLRKLKKADKEIKSVNESLTKTNQRLQEANKIKEDYIGYYFNNNSTSVDRIEKLKNTIEKSLQQGKIDLVRFEVNKINPHKEREKLYEDFDKAFLSLYPNFVHDFNNLFDKKDQIQLEKKDCLNTDLRIFALIRLGIHENDKVANILKLSVNTIYTYKTKIRNKSIVPNEEFINRVMQIRFR